MTIQSDYGEWPVLQEIYLEDSYVLEILEHSSELIFRMEFVLREGHPGYRAPREGEQYCYELGELTFRGAREIRWLERKEVQSFDATGECDQGNIDALYCENGRFTASGDWGRVSLAADEVVVNLHTDRAP